MKRCATIAVSIWIASHGLALGADSVAEIFKRVRDSVVVISTVESDPAAAADGSELRFGGLGSGVLIDRLGVVLTAAHVVQVAEAIEVEFTNGEVIAATVAGSEPAVDLAVLKLEHPPTSAVAAPLGDSDAVEVGDQIIVIGAPLGITHTLTVGHVSARRISNSLADGFTNAEMLQTDAVINVGNSGGPMFNMSGEVVGIVSHMITQSGGFEGLGFAMTTKMARELLLGRPRPWTGLEGYTLDGDLAAALGVPQELAILVQRVAKNSPADRMGLRGGTIEAEIEGEPILLGGDVILAVQGIRVSDADGLERIETLLRTLTPKEKVRVTVLRRGRRIDLSGTLSPR